MIKKTAEISIKSDADKAASGIRNIKKDLKEAKDALIASQDAFGDYSKEALEAARKVAELKDKIQEAKETSDLFDPGAKFSAFGGTLNAVAGGFSVVTGAMGTFGAESEDVEKMLLKVNSAMALTTGLSAVADSSKDFKRMGTLAVGSFKSIKTAASATFTGIKGGIAATGLGIFLIALGLIVANWDDIRKSIEKAFPAFKNIGELFNTIKQYAYGLGETIKTYVLAPFKALGKVFQGDFKGAIAEMQNGLNFTKSFQKGAAKEAQSQADEAAKLKLEKQIASQEKSLEVLKASGKDSYGAELAILKQKQKLYADDKEKLEEVQQEIRVLNASHNRKLSDEAKSASEKAQAKRKADSDKAIADKKASDDAYKNALKQLNNDIENIEDDSAQEKLDRQKSRELVELNSLKDRSAEEIKILKEAHEKKFKLLQEALNNEEALKDKKEKEEVQAKLDKTKKEIDAEIEKNRLKASFGDANNIEDLNRIYNQLKAELDLKQQALIDEFKQKQKADLDAYEAEYGKGEGYFTLKETQGTLIKDLETSQGQEQLDLKKQFSDKAEAIAKEEEAFQKRKVEAIGKTLENASNLLGQHTLAGKALAIASTTISTYQSAVDSYKGMVAAIPGPGGIAAGAIAAASSVAMGLQSVKKIISVKVPAKGGASGGGGASAPSAPPTPSVSFQNSPQTQVSDSINEASKNREAQPVKAYVVSSEVQSGISADRNRINSATF